MPLSRNFYSLDEVQASLVYYTQKLNRCQEAVFWCNEMLVSGLVAEAISTLFESWLWHTGPCSTAWLCSAWNTLAADEISPDDILLSAYQLAACKKRDNSLWSILILSARDIQPDTVTPKTPCELPSEDVKEIFFVRALYQGKAATAWWISLRMDAGRVWEILEWFSEHIAKSEEGGVCLEALQNYEKLLGFRSAEYDVIVRCLAVIMMSAKSQNDLPQEMDAECISMLQDLEKGVGTVLARKYSVPTECLYGFTARGQRHWSQSNFSQLNNVEKNLLGCPFWDEALLEYAVVRQEDGSIAWNSEGAMDEFYERYFPDDIPDEWTLGEKKKSHGDGILGPEDTPNLWKFSRVWMSKPQHFAWCASKIANKYLEEINSNDCNPCKIVERILSKKDLAIDISVLEPVRRKKIIDMK